ncbi:glycosyl hydrolase family 76-domain-containing protein [Lasiosphaeria miniovina]|uniref:mannan endo-1,6-alpha-mannosidase n=1 Tax=Lasiosphaeria miniovina TaxID=1954250 RepID=A0AA40BG73_9PEZI|nr:glycosyl hydrolase family 76-domain-containing protein [Lasiosphaeria miniovina]KAK0733663.1 glycosyl hydrolase family 76-domain-containing protein [Lasiosphaeria miniovina]
MAEDMMSFYHGDQPGGTPGLLPLPYYWWEAGALMGSLVDYWYYTGDSRWNNITKEGMLYQVGPNNDYMPPNQTMTEGNDDQGFWGMAVMSAAEYNFQNPPSDKPQWLALAQAVFNTQAARWDSQDCGGGLRWQIFTWNNGYDYKNSISQACFFNIAARLARYTGNQSYAGWADRTWDWMVDAKLLDPKTYYIYDGTHINNCSAITPYQWTYNAGAFLLGAAAMYNYTSGTTRDMWKQRVNGLLDGINVFFAGNKSDVMTEVACEPVNLCDLDQQSFKAYLSRWMASTTKWAPWTYDRIKPLLATSAIAAASTCTGGDNKRMCGHQWTEHGKWDGSTGVGQQMSAMEIVLANMIQQVTAPVTNSTGGTSAGNPGAGGSDVGRTDPFDISGSFPPMTTAGRVGAYICTALMAIGLLCGCAFTVSQRVSGLRSVAALGGVGGGGGGRGGILRNAHNDDKGKIALMQQSESENSFAYTASAFLEKDDEVMVNTHYLVPSDEAYYRTPRPAPRPPPLPPRYHMRTQSPGSASPAYWRNNTGGGGGGRFAGAGGVGHGNQRLDFRRNNSLQSSPPPHQQPQRISFPRVDGSTSLRKKAIHNRVVHFGRDINGNQRA